MHQILLKIHFNLAWPSLISFDPHSFTENLFFSKLLILSNYFIEFGLTQYPKELERRGEKCVGTGQEKLPSFTKITEEMSQLYAEEVIIIYRKSMEKSCIYLDIF